MLTFPGLYNRIRNTRSCQLRTPLLAGAATTTLAVLVCGVGGVRLNSTASLPIGLYVVGNAPDAVLAEFCPPEPFARISAARGYRHAGICPDGNSPLLKPLVAKAGDIVVTSARGITVNGKLLPNTAPRGLDSKGRPLTHYPFETNKVEPGFDWVASTYHPLSFDSRYFGPIPSCSIRERLKPLLVY